MQLMLCTRVLHRPASCCDDFGREFPQRHNRQMLAWIVLLSTVLGKTVDQSEYVFNDACFTREQLPKALPGKPTSFCEYWVLIMITERAVVLYFMQARDHRVGSVSRPLFMTVMGSVAEVVADMDRGAENTCPR